MRDPKTGRFVPMSKERPTEPKPLLSLGNLIAFGIMVGVVIAAAVLIR